MHEAQFLASIRDFEKKDAVDHLGAKILKEFHMRGYAITMVQCTIIDTATNKLRIWIFCDDATTPTEEMVKAMQKPKSSAIYTISNISQQVIIETDGNNKLANHFLFMFLYQLGHMTYEAAVQKLRDLNIAP